MGSTAPLCGLSLWVLYIIFGNYVLGGLGFDGWGWYVDLSFSDLDVQKKKYVVFNELASIEHKHTRLPPSRRSIQAAVALSDCFTCRAFILEKCH